MIPTFTFGAAYVPGLQVALHEVQDAHTYLLGRERVSEAMGCHQRAGLALQKFLFPLKVL